MVIAKGRPRPCRYCGVGGCASSVHSARCAVLCPDCVRHNNVAKSFGLILRNYCYLYQDEFRGKCGICDKEKDFWGEKEIHLAVDHVHMPGTTQSQAAERGLIRGILRSSCNKDIAKPDLEPGLLVADLHGTAVPEAACLESDACRYKAPPKPFVDKSTASSEVTLFRFA